MVYPSTATSDECGEARFKGVDPSCYMTLFSASRP